MSNEKQTAKNYDHNVKMYQLSHIEGELQVWWVPQVPGKPFEVSIEDAVQGVKIMDVLANYDDFQFKNNIKPDYCNAGGLRVWVLDSDGYGTPGWEDWYDDATGIDDPREWLEKMQNG